jgi:hypothetical protein
VTYLPPVVRLLAGRLEGLGWVTDLLVAGSLATGDYVPGVSDLDLVALTGGPVGPARQEILTDLHRDLDQGAAQGLDLGCVYVDAGRLADLQALHPTWTHGSLVQRSLSGVTRAELVRHGFAVLGRPPAAVLQEMTDDDVRRAARAELCGYWARATRRPLWWLDPVIADLGADVDGTRPPRPADGPAADQDAGGRAGACAGLVERRAPRPAAGPAGGLAAGPDSADRVAGCTTDRDRGTPQRAILNSRAGTTRPSSTTRHNTCLHDLSWAILVRKLVAAVDRVDGLAQVARKRVGCEF